MKRRAAFLGGCLLLVASHAGPVHADTHDRTAVLASDVAKVGAVPDVSSLAVAPFTRKHESTTILTKLFDSATAPRSQVAIRTTRSAPTRVAQAPAPDPIKVAIVPGVAVNIDAARVDALSQDMADALEAELLVDAVGGLEVRRRLPANGVPPDCVANPTCVADVAKQLGANELLFLVMVDTGGDGAVQIDTTWVDPATGKSASRPAIDIVVINEAKSRFAAAATQLLPDAPVRPKPPVGGGVQGEMTKAVPRHFTTASYVTAGLAVVGLGVGIGFGLRTKGLYDDCDAAMTPCSSAQEDKIRNSALFADIGWVAALGGAVATAILYATSGSESRLIVSPNAESGGGMTVTAVGRF